MTDPGFLLSPEGGRRRARGFKDGCWRARASAPSSTWILLIPRCPRRGSPQQELCTAARIDSGNMVELLDGLEALRYAQRARDPHDRRRYVVTITPAGRSALADLRQAVGEYNERVLSPLTGREQRQLAATLGKLFTTTAEGRGR